MIDAGAEAAILHNGRSLLPAGVIDVAGEFSKGEVVEVVGPNGLVGKGQTLYDSDELLGIKGMRSHELSHENLKSFTEITGFSTYKTEEGKR